MSKEKRTHYRATIQGIDEFETAVRWAEKYMKDVLQNKKIIPKGTKIEVCEEYRDYCSDQPTTYCAEVDIEFDAELE